MTSSPSWVTATKNPKATANQTGNASNVANTADNLVRFSKWQVTKLKPSSAAAPLSIDTA
jgi:hypothetical protein